MSEFLKRPIVIGIFLAAVLISIIWSYVDKKRQDNQTAKQQADQQIKTSEIVNLTNVDATDFDAVVKNELDLANTKAKEANLKYQLAALEIEMPGTLLPNTGNDRYVYTADNDKSNNWTITISQSTSNYLRAIIPKDDYLGSLQPINQGLWKFNYVTALQIAEKNGGKDWREKNSPTSLKLTLRHKPPKNWLTWTVEYSTDKETFSKDIDANSGQIIEEAQQTSSQS
jgi:type II secretory pathway pseudopilin PulG